MTPARAVANTVQDALLDQGALEEVEEGADYGQSEAVLYATTPDGRSVTITIDVALY